jgi:hypothetical protein
MTIGPPVADGAEARGGARALAAAVLAILVGEADHPPLSAAALARVLHVTGYVGGPVTVPKVEGAMDELVAAGQVDRIWRRGAAHYRLTGDGRSSGSGLTAHGVGL